MVTGDTVAAVRFGRTLVASAVGVALDQEVEAVVLASTCRGLLATGVAGALRARGAGGIERLAMAAAPLELGSALVTAASGLEGRGVRAVLHAVVYPTLGETARLDDVRRAVAAVLTAAEGGRFRSLALPLLGVEGGSIVGPGVAPVVAAIVDALVGCLRRGEARPERVVLVARTAALAALVDTAIERARERDWTLRR